MALTPFCPAVKEGTKVDIYRACFNHAKIFFFFLKKKTNIALQFPNDHPIHQESQPLPFMAPLAVILWPPGGSAAANTSQVCHTTILHAPRHPSVLGSVGRESLCPMKLQRAGDILQAAELPRAALPRDVLPVGAAGQGHHGAQGGGPLAHLHLEH